MREQLIDPSVISQCFSTEDVEGMWDSPYANEEELKVLQQLRDRLPKDLQFFYNAFCKGMTQIDIADELGISQPSVHSKFQALFKALRILHEIKPLSSKEANKFLRMIPKKKRKFFRTFMQNANQSYSARKCGLSPNTASLWVIDAIANDELPEEFRDYLDEINKVPSLFNLTFKFVKDL